MSPVSPEASVDLVESADPETPDGGSSLPSEQTIEVPALPLHEVEAAHPHLRRALRRFREQRATA